MTGPHLLQPTLWRTCRVLANRTRLRMFGLLVQEPDLTVSAVAERLNLSLPVASQYLRALEARGLLTVRRVGRRVRYRPSAATGGEPAPALVTALRLSFQGESSPVEALFKQATAFTHPRRIKVFRALKQEARTLGQLKAVTGISAWALLRHLVKLEARGFVVGQQGIYRAADPPDAFGSALARLAAE